MKVTLNGKALIPSKYLEALDLGKSRVPVIIDGIEFAKMRGDEGDERKPLFRLRGKEKGWVLNTTNLNSIAEVYGPKAEAWIGKTVVIYGTKVEAFGEIKLAIRVDIDATQAAADKAKSNGASHGTDPEATEPAHDADGVVAEAAQ